MVAAKIKGLTARVDRLKTLQSAIELARESGTAALSEEYGERVTALLESGTFASKNNVAHRD